MTPDASALRAAARTLDDQAGALETARGEAQSSTGSTTWVAAAADRQRAELARVDALARTAVAELEAAGGHLRRLATAVEDVEQAMRLAHARRRTSLQTALTDASASADPARAVEATDLRKALNLLPAAGDASWSRQVEVPSVPIPVVPAARSTATPGPYAPTSVVVVVGEVRALAGVLDGRAQVAADTRTRAAGAVVLPFSRLDAFGLPGSSTGGFLAGVTSSAGEHGRVSTGWSDAAGRARALAALVDSADAAGSLDQVLGDPRAELALDLAVLLETTSYGDEDVEDLLSSVSEDDGVWLLENVPGLADRVQLPFPSLESTDLLNGLLLAPAEAGSVLTRRGDALGVQAKTLKPLRSQGTPAVRADRRAEYRALIRQMREARANGARLSGLTSRVPALGTALRVADYRLLPSVPVARNVPVLSVALTGVGIYDDIENRGLEPSHAVVKNVGATAAGLATTVAVTAGVTALAAGTVVAGVALAPLVIGVAVGAVVGYGVGLVLDEYGDDIVDWAGDAWDGLFG